MNENFTNDLLIQYLDGELQGETLEQFTRELENSASLRQELEHMKLAKEAVALYGLKDRIGSLHREIMQERSEKNRTPAPVKHMLLTNVWRAAAVLILLVGVSALYQYLTASPTKLYNETFQPFALRETRGDYASPLEEEYKKGNLDSVILTFKSLNAPVPDEYLLTGVALLATAQPAKAAEVLQSLLRKNDSTKTQAYQEDAEYYLGLSYLANDEAAKALPIFEKISNEPDHAYHKKADFWFLAKLRHSIKSGN